MLVGPHGGDLINGFALHAGASVVEMLPVERPGCPCHVFRELYASDSRRIFHYTASTSNRSFTTPRCQRCRIRFQTADLILPVTVLKAALERVAEVAGDPQKYQHKEFKF